MNRLMLTGLATLAMVVAGCTAGGGSGGGSKPVRLAITNTGLPAGVIGVPYTAQLNAVGGEAPYTFGANDPLPAGLTLDTSSGLISGTPTATFTGDIEFTLTDSYPATVASLLNMQVTTPPALSLTANLGPAIVSASYTGAAQAGGGVAPYTYFVSTGTLPNGLTMDPASGAITGTPTTVGSYAFTLGVNDSATQQQLLPTSIDVLQGVSLFTPTTLPDAFTGFDWYARVEAMGGLPPYSFNITGAPAWVQASTKGDGWLELTGTPAAPGAVSFTVEVTDSTSAISQSQCVTTVSDPLSSAQGDSQVVTTAAPRATVDEYYEFDVHASGGFAPYYWSATGLPDGMYFDAGVSNPGKLRGRPRVAGVYNLTLLAEDGVHGVVPSSFQFVVEPNFEDLLNATVGTEYFHTAAVNTGGATVGMQLVSGASSGGLDCNVATGVQVSGVPSAAARQAFAVQLSMGGSDVIHLVGVDVQQAATALQVTTTQLPNAVAGNGYDYLAYLQAEGGSGTGYQWSLAGGSLPPGIMWQSNTGPNAAELAGVVTQTGTFTFTVQVSDSASNTAQATLSIDVVAPRAGDVNGDGCPDLVLGSKWSGTNGGLKLYYGEPAQTRFGLISMEDSDWTYAGSTDNCRLADLNGDGISDIVLNQRAVQQTLARILIWYGSRKNPLLGTAGAPDCEIIDATAADTLGSAIGTGDLDGDGYEDLVVGARLADINKTDAGAVYIFYGGATKLTGTMNVSAADAVLTANVAGSMNTYWGYAATGYLGDSVVVQDIDGDGKADIGAGAAGQVYLLYSLATRHAGTINIQTAAQGTFNGLTGSRLSERIALGDFNGDNRTDIVVAGHRSYVFYGATGAYPLMGASDAGSTGAEIEMPTTSSTTLYAGVEALDLNADGIDDFAFALPENATGLVFYGTTTMLSGVVPYANADVTLGFGGGDYAPWFVRKLDVDDDGVDDLMVGIPNWTGQTANGPTSGAGGAAVINGSASNPPVGGITPAVIGGLKFIGELASHGWGTCAAGG